MTENGTRAAARDRLTPKLTPKPVDTGRTRWTTADEIRPESFHVVRGCPSLVACRQFVISRSSVQVRAPAPVLIWGLRPQTPDTGTRGDPTPLRSGGSFAALTRSHRSFLIWGRRPQAPDTGTRGDPDPAPFRWLVRGAHSLTPLNLGTSSFLIWGLPDRPRRTIGSLGERTHQDGLSREGRCRERPGNVLMARRREAGRHRRTASGNRERPSGAGAAEHRAGQRTADGDADAPAGHRFNMSRRLGRPDVPRFATRWAAGGSR